ncbi:hypothetical protein B0T26DRAFT_755646 [Lasiosphaeria miniovina]|uniref:Rhodopsin domain-containing protein n=1 Tax=Lasiosphaeria miniovina TaxID=1954250 RepID=A0AA40DLZ0_9PEZI|nr:uncharacterized protein B0T26DRAFT_755646 [Lasiosphaeria miniovina]KAK0706116.1 hypothetical protein B0T26DRAFT_755646 [Lasiosphaeria miniovina]
MSGPANATATGLVPLLPPTEINDTHKVYSMAQSFLVMMFLATGVCVWRLVARFRAGNFGLDDYTAVVALLAYIAWSTLAVYANLNAGVGKPLWEITLGEYTIWFKILMATAFLYPIMSTLVRTSIILFYQRIFGVPGSRFRVLCWVFIGVNVAYMATFAVLSALMCRAAGGDLDLFPLKCNIEYSLDTNTAMHGVGFGLDVVLTALPIYPVLRLHMPRRQKAGIALLFLLGASATAAAGVKFVL